MRSSYDSGAMTVDQQHETGEFHYITLHWILILVATFKYETNMNNYGDELDYELKEVPVTSIIQQSRQDEMIEQIEEQMPDPHELRHWLN